jgi:hypothetical protein
VPATKLDPPAPNRVLSPEEGRIMTGIVREDLETRPEGWEEPDINEGADDAAVAAAADPFAGEEYEPGQSDRDYFTYLMLEAENTGTSAMRFGTIRARLLLANGHGTKPEEIA